MIDKYRKLVEEQLKENNISLYDVEIVQDLDDVPGRHLVFYVEQNGGFDINTIELPSKIINEIIDAQSDLDDVDYVSVTSPGAERALKTKEQLKDAVGDYVHLDFMDENDNLTSVEGTLASFDDDILHIQYKVKNINKKMDIAYSNVKYARLAVKF